MQFITFQTAIGVTGTAQQLPVYPVVKSIAIHASSSNQGSIVLGNAPTVTLTSGFVLEKGDTVSIPASNSGLFAVVTSGDVVSIIGA